VGVLSNILRARNVQRDDERIEHMRGQRLCAHAIPHQWQAKATRHRQTLRLQRHPSVRCQPTLTGLRPRAHRS
jgi:hypothetical protein